MPPSIIYLCIEILGNVDVGTDGFHLLHFSADAVVFQSLEAFLHLVTLLVFGEQRTARRVKKKREKMGFELFLLSILFSWCGIEVSCHFANDGWPSFWDFN